MFVCTKKTVAFVAIFSSAVCCASEVPENSVQLEYQKMNVQITPDNNLLSIDTVYQIPVATYRYLDEVFTSLYNKVTFKTNITDSTFDKNSHYELVSIPLIAENEQGLQVELFGNFTDPNTQQLSNLSKDQTLSYYLSNTQKLDLYESEISLGAGFSVNTSKNSKIKVIISNNDIPGYGNSKALLGFEANF